MGNVSVSWTEGVWDYWVPEGVLSDCILELFYHHGEYAAILLGVLNPLAVDDDWYWVTAFVMIGFLVFSVFCMWRLVADGSRKERLMADIAASVTCIILIELVPRAIDMFYWFDGAVNYTPYYAMLLIMTGLFVRLCRQGQLSRRAMVVMCILTWFSMGGNAIPMVVNFVIVVGWGYAAFILYRGEVYGMEWRIPRLLEILWHNSAVCCCRCSDRSHRTRQ